VRAVERFLSCHSGQQSSLSGRRGGTRSGNQLSYRRFPTPAPAPWCARDYSTRSVGPGSPNTSATTKRCSIWSIAPTAARPLAFHLMSASDNRCFHRAAPVSKRLYSLSVCMSSHSQHSTNKYPWAGRPVGTLRLCTKRKVEEMTNVIAVFDELVSESLLVRKRRNGVCAACKQSGRGVASSISSGDYASSGNLRQLLDGEGVRMRFFSMFTGGRHEHVRVSRRQLT
jgi:hypothetical protein